MVDPRPLTAALASCTRVLVLAALAVGTFSSVVHAVVIVPDGFEDQLYASGAYLTVGLEFLPDGRMLVVELKQPAPDPDIGELHLIVDGSVVQPPLLSIQNITTGNERGLLAVAVDPEWPLRPYVYVYFTHSDGHCYLRMYTASGDLSDPSSTNLTLSDPYEILTDIPDNSVHHNGGTLRFGPDGMLYVSCGDDADGCGATDLSTLQGVILRLDVSALPGPGGGPPTKSLITPSDNPFPGPNENERLVFCYGLRNPYHYSIDRMTGRLYIGDVGGTEWEELDEAAGGEFFGWPRREGAHDQSSACPGDPGVDPIWEYPHDGVNVFSIIGGPIYRPAPSGGIYDFPAEYDGDVFFIEHYQREMRRLTFDSQAGAWVPADPVAGQPSPDVWGSGFLGVSDIKVGPDGAIYYTEYNTSGKVRRIINTQPGAVDGVHSPAAKRIRLTISPNPMRRARMTSVSYTVPADGKVTVTVYTVTGERVVVLASGLETAGRHERRWDGRLPDGSRAAPGVYFVRVRMPDGFARGKLTIF